MPALDKNPFPGPGLLGFVTLNPKPKTQNLLVLEAASAGEFQGILPVRVVGFADGLGFRGLGFRV